MNGLPPICNVSPTFLGLPWASGCWPAIFRLITILDEPRSPGSRKRPSPFSLKCSRKHGAVQVLMGDDVLARDHRLVKQRIDRLLAGEQAADQHPPPLDRGGDPPDLGRDRPNSGHAPQVVDHTGRQMTENRARHILTQDDQPLDPAQRITHQISQTVREAEEPQHSQDRDRQAQPEPGPFASAGSAGCARRKYPSMIRPRQGTADRQLQGRPARSAACGSENYSESIDLA